VNSDQAQIDNAAATLGYAKIIAPLSGRAGLRRSIRATSFTLRRHGARLYHPAAADRGAVQSAAAADRAVNAASAKGVLAVDVFGNDGVTVIDTGKLTGIDNQVDPTPGH